MDAEILISETLTDSLDIKIKHTNFKSILKESEAIASKLERFGYLESKLNTIKKENDSVFTAGYYLGEKTASINIYFNPAIFKKKELEKIGKENNENFFTIAISEIENKLYTINRIIASDGNTFARLRLTHFKKVDGKLSARLETEKGQQRTIDSIAIKGYDKFPKSFLKYFAGVNKKQLFDKTKLATQNKILNSLGFINTLKAPEALFRKDSTVVYFYVEKRNFNTFDGILGFATNEETNNIEFNGYLNLELNNNLNFGEQVLFNYKADGDNQRNFRIKTTFPYIAKSPIGIAMELKIFRRDSTFSNTTQSATINYQLNPKTKIEAGYTGKNSSNLLEIGTINIANFKARFAKLAIKYQQPEASVLYQTKTRINTSIAQGERTTETKEEKQTIVTTIISTAFKLNDKNSIYVKNQTRLLLSPSYLTNELFRFGGIKSIRGFTENSIDATLFSTLNTEYRYALNANSFIHSIIDIGYFENQIINQKEKIYSFGMGLGLITKAGVLNLNIANGNIDSQDFKFSNTKIHISLTSRF